MKLFRNFTVTCCAVLTLSLPALAAITVNSPANDSDVSTTFKLSASASACSSQTSMQWDIPSIAAVIPP